MKEIEIKIKIDDRAGLIKRIEMLGGKKILGDEGLVSDIMYNNLSGDFDVGNKKGRHLRLRKAPFGNRLTYKEKLDGKKHAYLLKRTEIETAVEDVEKTDLILIKLGFVHYLVREKLILDYSLDGFRLEFHTLPFLGEFLEIEAEEKELTRILQKLGLEITQGINKGYHQLFSEYCKKHGWQPETPLTFEQEQISKQTN